MTEPTKESRKEAMELLDDEAGYPGAYGSEGPPVTVLARTLDKLHGRTPVDPLLIEARKICAKRYEGMGYQYLAGDRDGYFEMRNTLADLRRGMELAPKPRMPTEAETREALARYYEATGLTTTPADVRAGGHSGYAQAFHTTVTEMLEQINEREGV